MNLKKFSLIFTVLFFTVSCTKSTGSLSGNVYWKYNDIIGNKPDAGTTIKLYDVKNKSNESLYSITTDIDGNYKLDNISSGSYIIVVNSKNTFSSPRTIFENLQAHEKELEFLNFNIRVYSNQVDQLGNLKLLTELSANEPLEFEKNNEELNSRFSSIIQQFPNDVKGKLNIKNGYDNSIYIKEIKIENSKNTIENIDFGFKNN